MRSVHSTTRTLLAVVVGLGLLGVVGGCDSPAGPSIPDGNGEEIEGGGGVYAIGDQGPAGGWIFYIDEADDFLWTYLEAAPVDMEFSSQWGGTGALVGGDAQGTAIGAGTSNTNAIVSFFDRLEHVDTGESYYDFDWDSVGLVEVVFTDGSQYYSMAGGANDGTVAAKGCVDLVVVYNGESYDDWFLPSKDELNLMRANVRQHFTSAARWSSTEDGNDGEFAWYQFFGTGQQNTYVKHANWPVRAARAF